MGWQTVYISISQFTVRQYASELCTFTKYFKCLNTSNLKTIFNTLVDRGNN